LLDRDKWETTASTLELRCKELEAIGNELERKLEAQTIARTNWRDNCSRAWDERDEWKAAAATLERRCKELSEELDEMREGVYDTGRGKLSDRLDETKAASRRTLPIYGATPEPLVERSLSQVRIKPLHPELGKSIPLPTRATPGAVGYDVCAAIDDLLDLYGQDQALIPLGFAVEIPRGYEMQIRPLSGLALWDGVTVLNAPATIDPDYRGEVQVLLVNHNVYSARVTIMPGDRIAQIVFAPVETPELVVTDELSETERGEGGFGSTGV